MRWVRRAASRLAGALRLREDPAADTAAELEAHLEMEIAENIRRGLPPDEARRRAYIASGGLVQAAEQVRAQRGLPWLEAVAADLRFAIRFFSRTPATSASMVFVLALGIGATIVLFTVVNSVATMAAPGIERDESVVRIRGMMRSTEGAGQVPRLLSWNEVGDYAARKELFSEVGAYVSATEAVRLGGADAPETATRVLYTTSNYFRVLGVRLAAGAPPAAEADETRQPTVPSAVISHSLARHHFGGVEDALGKALRVNGLHVQVSGVGPPMLTGTEGRVDHAVWLPIGLYPLLRSRSPAIFASPDSSFLSAAARLRQGVTRAEATPAVAGIAARFSTVDRVDVSASAGRGVRISGGDATADVAPMLASNYAIGGRDDMIVSVGLAAVMAALILIITCVNVSTLLVGLAVSRRREISVRLSLGAPRGRLIRQLLTESVFLALCAAAAGLIATSVAIQLLGSRVAGMQLVVDWRVVTATCAVALSIGVLFGLSPALHAIRSSVNEALRDSASSIASGSSWLQRGLVVTQIAFTQALLVGMGVLILGAGPGRDGRVTSPVGDHVAIVELDSWSGTPSNEERAARVEGVVATVAALPGVSAAVPMQAGPITSQLEVHPDDRVVGVSPEGRMEAVLNAAPSGYFDIYGIPIVRGRDFDPSERVPAPGQGALLGYFQAVIIGSDLAQHLWGDADPIGRRFRVALPGSESQAPLVVVGIVDPAVAGAARVNGRIRAFVPYHPLYSGVTARTTAPAAAMLNELRRAVSAAAPQMPITRAQTVAQEESDMRRNLLIASAAAAGGGVIALLLSGFGLYAVVSFMVRQRTREIGIRIALGEVPKAVVQRFFTTGLVLSILGVLGGLPLSVAATRLLADALRLPIGTSWVLVVGIGLAIIAISAVAVWLPARRASSVPPSLALAP